ncbi:MAG: hypothetical protein AABZ77_03860, partial [Chloroflexota bacterium]
NETGCQSFDIPESCARTTTASGYKIAFVVDRRTRKKDFTTSTKVKKRAPSAVAQRAMADRCIVAQRASRSAEATQDKMADKPWRGYSLGCGYGPRKGNFFSDRQHSPICGKRPTGHPLAKGDVAA